MTFTNLFSSKLSINVFFAFRRAEETSVDNSFSTQKTVAIFQSQAFTWKKLKKSSSEI